MPGFPTTLQQIDYTLMAAGGSVLVFTVVVWWCGGRRDRLRGSPIRANTLSLLAVWACILASFLGWTIGPKLADLTAPKGLEAGGLKAWQGVFSANLTQVLVAVTCLWVAKRTFTGGWRGLGIGRRPVAIEVAYSLAGWLSALAACGLIVWVTKWVLDWLMPRFQPPDHSVFAMLKDPATTAWMRATAIGGAFILAPIGEELLFRGILQTGIKKLMWPKRGSMRHRWYAVGITALIFAAMHSATPQHVAALAALGVILGYLYERTGSLVVPITVHMLFNGKSLLWHYLL